MILSVLPYVLFLSPLLTSAFAVASQTRASSGGQYIFNSQNISYLSDLSNPILSLSGHCAEVAAKRDVLLITAIHTEGSVVKRDQLEDLVARYTEQDDVFSRAFLEGVYISSSYKEKASLHPSALEFLAESGTRTLFVDAATFTYNTSIWDYGTGVHYVYVKPEPAVKKKVSVTHVSAKEVAQQTILSQNRPATNLLPGGPWIARVHRNAITLSAVYRLYSDDYSDFLFGAYQTDDVEGTFKAVDSFDPKYGKALIPVPSRIYSWNDGRSLAGQRIAIKDLYDIKGLQTAGGSHAWATITGIANISAPSVQQIIDLGGIIVGKFKTAQFAAGINPWEWVDVHYPFNPRGDGYLTCSGSSSGGGCAIAAYDWLDYAVGSDTGSSMRVPAAVSGTYGNRPSQGMMNLEGVLPISQALDTAGVFCRDPIKWIKFAKAWYQPFLRQPMSVTGLSPLVVKDTTAYPKRLLYLSEYLPLANPAAETLLQQFIGNLSTIFNLKVSEFDLVSFIKSANTEPPILDSAKFIGSMDNVLDGKGQWEAIARPLIAAWAALHDGRFPPLEKTWRSDWQNYSSFNISDEERYAHYALGLKAKKFATDWFETNVLFETEESCSESIMIYDIALQGLPEYREQNMNNDSGTFQHYIDSKEGKKRRDRTKELSGATICPAFGCVDFTLPIGQVPYRSNITFVEEMMPVTVSLIARRGCDFMLFNMVEKLFREGVLKTVKTGRAAF